MLGSLAGCDNLNDPQLCRQLLNPMAASEAKLEEANKLVKKANKLLSPSILDFRLKPDWEAAAPLLDRACLLYKV